MNLHLTEISARVTPGRHAVLLLDQAGWHMSGEVAVPDNITLLPLPPKCPELNVMENVWQFMRGQLALQPGVSATTTTSPATAAITGTGSSLSHGASCPSECAIGHIGSDQRELV